MFGRRDGLTRELLDVVAQACEKRWNVNRTHYDSTLVANFPIYVIMGKKV